MAFDFDNVLRFTFVDWFKQKGVWKYVGVLFVFYFLMNLVSSYVIYSVFAPLGSPSTFDPAMVINMMIAFFGYLGILIVFSLIIGTIVSYFVTSKALDSKKYSFVGFNFSRWIRYIVLMFAQSIAVLFSIFKLRLLLVLLVAFVLFIIGIILAVMGGINAVAGALLILLSLLFCCAYMVIVVYNSIRLTLSPVIFIESERGIMQSLRTSWEITRGNALNIFVVLLAVGLAVALVAGVLSAPLNVYAGFNGASVAEADSVDFATLFGKLLDPISILLSIPQILVQSIGVLIEAFAMVGIYSELKNSKGALGRKLPKTSKSKKVAKKAKRK